MTEQISKQITLQTNTIFIDGQEVSFLRAGQKGPWVVILPGWGSRKEKWDHVQLKLLEIGYSSICVDLPGFGNSQDPPSTWQSKDYAKWLESFLISIVGEEAVILMGHSFGGKIASLYSVMHPEMVSFLILLASAGIPIKKSYRQRTAYIAAKLFGRIFKLPLFRLVAKPFKQYLYRFSGSSDYYKANENMKKVFKSVVHEDMRQKFRSINVKTTIVWGESDVVTPLWQGKLIHELIKASTLHVILGASHNFPYEGSEFLNMLENIVEVK